TLCKTPRKPEDWQDTWWNNKASLEPPYVKDDETCANPEIVEKYKQARKEDTTMVVMMTGRIKPLANHVLAILKRSGIEPKLDGKKERAVFCTGDKTLDFKITKIKE